VITAVVSTVPRELNTGLAPLENWTVSEVASSTCFAPSAAVKVPVEHEALLMSW
jgi:hypothetical protein